MCRLAIIRIHVGSNFTIFSQSAHSEEESRESEGENWTIGKLAHVDEKQIYQGLRTALDPISWHT